MFIQVVVLSLVAVAGYVSCQDNVPGGIEPYCTSLNDPLVQDAVKAIQEYFVECDKKNRNPVKVIKASVQIVAGQIYRFKIQFSGGQTLENCKVEILRPLKSNSTEVLKAPQCKEAKRLLS